MRKPGEKNDGKYQRQRQEFSIPKLKKKKRGEGHRKLSDITISL